MQSIVENSYFSEQNMKHFKVHDKIQDYYNVIILDIIRMFIVIFIGIEIMRGKKKKRILITFRFLKIFNNSLLQQHTMNDN